MDALAVANSVQNQSFFKRNTSFLVQNPSFVYRQLGALTEKHFWFKNFHWNFVDISLNFVEFLLIFPWGFRHFSAESISMLLAPAFSLICSLKNRDFLMKNDDVVSFLGRIFWWKNDDLARCLKLWGATEAGRHRSAATEIMIFYRNSTGKMIFYRNSTGTMMEFHWKTMRNRGFLPIFHEKYRIVCADGGAWTHRRVARCETWPYFRSISSSLSLYCCSLTPFLLYFCSISALWPHFCSIFRSGLTFSSAFGLIIWILLVRFWDYCRGRVAGEASRI